MQKNIDTLIEDNSMEYSSYILTSRVIPDLRDSCKPVVRRIIYTMYKEKAYKFTKSATMSGKVMAIHPHGDCYPTMVGMTQKDNQIIPWLEGKGNYGQHTSRDLMYASSRYSETKLSPYTIDVLKGLNDKSVKYIPNYDGTLMMPEVLPVKFPMTLHYCQMGIGYGMSSNIPSFNMIEIYDGIEKYIKFNKKTNLIPDFATGGNIINNDDNIEKINNTGLGSVSLRGSYEIKGNSILINEIPYTTTREAIIDKIRELVKNGKLKEITKINDLTGLNGMCIKIECKKSTDMNLLVGKLFTMTPLESTFSCNINVISNGLPKVLGVWDIIDEWLKWRKECIIATYKEDIIINKKKLHLYEGLTKIIDYIDEVISIIRNSNTDEEMIDNLRLKFDITTLQAEYISDIKIRNLNKAHINKTIKNQSELESEIQNLNKILQSDILISDIILKEMKEVSDKYGKPRKTTIIEKSDIKTTITQDDLIEDYSTQIVYTKQNYIKKNRKYSETQKLKDGDSVVSITQCSNKGKVIVLTDKQNAYFININDLNDVQPSALGQYLPNILPLDKEENILGALSTEDYIGNSVIIFENGKVSKIPLESYKTKTNRTKLQNSLTSENGEVIDIYQINEDVDVELTNSFGKTSTFNTKDINAKSSRNTVGVTMAKSTKKGFKIISSKLI